MRIADWVDDRTDQSSNAEMIEECLWTTGHDSNHCQHYMKSLDVSTGVMSHGSMQPSMLYARIVPGAT